MRKRVWVAISLIMAVAVIGFAQAPPRGARRGTGRGRAQLNLPPSVSVRPEDSRRTLGVAPAILGWRVGAPAGAFRQLSFSEAAAKVDAAGLAFIVGSDEQKVSAEIPRNLDYNLSPADLAAVRHRLGELRLGMLAYRVAAIPADPSSQQKLFDFAKGLGVSMIIAGSGPASLVDLNKLASDSGVDVAIENRNPKNLPAGLQGAGPHIGLCANIGAWLEAGIKPQEGLAQVKDKLIAVDLRDRSALGAKGRDVVLGSGAMGLPQFLMALRKLEPPAVIPWPPTCGNCAGPRPEVKPLLLSVDMPDELPQSVAALEKDLRPVIGDRVDEIGRNTPITPSSMVPPEERKKIEDALPRQAIVKPLKPRKLLVLDFCPGGAFYHTTAAHGTLALELMAKYTGAYQPVFSNDVGNLKYPKIKQFDAVFLNGGDGPVFEDPAVLNGLMRFVREGGGLASLHGGSYASMDLPEFAEMIGAQDGPHRVEPAFVKIDDPNSPLTKAFGGKGFAWTDEFYHFLPTGPYTREKLHILLAEDTEKSDMSQWKVRPDNDYGLSWIRSYGKGRVFELALGHTPELFATPPMAEHIFAGIQFVLGDLKADTTPSAKLAAKK